MTALLLRHTISNGAEIDGRTRSKPGFEADLLLWDNEHHNDLGYITIRLSMEPSHIPELTNAETGNWLRKVLIDALSKD